MCMPFGQGVLGRCGVCGWRSDVCVAEIVEVTVSCYEVMTLSQIEPTHASM